MTGRNELAEYVESLRKADPQDDAAFQRLLETGMNLLQLLDKDVAEMFTVCRPTVTRWRNGTNSPHPFVRKPMYAQLADRAAALLRRMERVAAMAEATARPIKNKAAPAGGVV